MRSHTEGSPNPSAPVDADEAQDLRRRVRELEEAVRRLSEAPRSGATRKFRSARSRLVGVGAAALMLALAGGSMVVAQTVFQGLFIDKNGNVGIGTAEPGDNKLRVNGSVEMGGANPIRFTPQWSGFSDPTPNHPTNTAEISNDTSSFKALMVVGNSSAQAGRRQVQIYDDLKVPNGDVTAKSLTIGGYTVPLANAPVRFLVSDSIKAGPSYSGPIKNGETAPGPGYSVTRIDKHSTCGPLRDSFQIKFTTPFPSTPTVIALTAIPTLPTGTATASLVSVTESGMQVDTSDSSWSGQPPCSAPTWSFILVGPAGQKVLPLFGRGRE
jgi:hypothetical protein